MSKLIVIIGPTSSGKTKLAVALARKFKGEIVSADSRQVYRGMDIGTGKDLKAYSGERLASRVLLPAVPYHLVDIVSPKTQFTLAQYQRRAYQAIEYILRRGKLPMLVGGTGLYVQAVVDGYVLPKAPPDHKLRTRLSKLSLPQLRAKLRQLDAATYQVIDKHNRRRLERAIEICVSTGLPLSQQRRKQPPPYEVLMVGLDVPRDVLYQRIDKRLRERLKQGMVEEVARLHKQGISWQCLESFGLEYKYVGQFLCGRMEFTPLQNELFRAIKDFSRRQMTWFKRDKRIVWIKNRKEAEVLLQHFLK